MKRFIKKILACLLLFVILNLIVVIIYEYPAFEAIQNKTHKNYLKWNGIHNNIDAYDLIFLGSSRTYTGFNPKLIDEELDLNSFNMGTSAQDIAESYFTLKEILDYQKPKYIVLETYLDLSDTSHDFYQIISNSSFFNSTSNRYNLIVDGYGSKGIGNYIIPLMRFNNYIKQDIMSFFSKKNEKPPKNNWYKGFYSDTITVTQKQIKLFEPISNFNNKSFSNERFNTFFQKIYQLTNSKNIELIVIRTPYPPTRLKLNDNKDEESYYNEYFERIPDVDYYDLNYYKNHKYSYEDSYFSDFHHVNYRGSNIMSQQLIDIISNK